MIYRHLVTTVPQGMVTGVTESYFICDIYRCWTQDMGFYRDNQVKDYIIGMDLHPI